MTNEKSPDQFVRDLLRDIGVTRTWQHQWQVLFEHAHGPPAAAVT
ncbi:hypothetical protein [Citricoccus nitrophenolicus]